MVAAPRAARDGTLRIYRLLWALVALFTLYATTIPFNFTVDPVLVREHLALAIQHSAFTAGGRLSRTDVVQNILLFVPFGVLACASLTRRRPIGALLTTVVLAALLSGACELAQLTTMDRTSSVWDVYANVAGAFVGGTAWISGWQVIRRLTTRFALNEVEYRRLFPLWCAAALVCISAWEPFDFTLDVGSVWSKIKPFLNGVWFTREPVTDELLTVFRFALLAILMISSLQRRLGLQRARIVSAGVCSALAIALESTQFVITSRLPTVQDVAAAVSGVVGGVLVGPLVVIAPAVPMISMLTVIAAVPFYLQPFVVAPKRSPVLLVLFLGYYQYTTLQTVSHVLDLMLIYAPIGFALEWTGRHGGMARAAFLSCVMAGLLEYAQGWIVGRYPDPTDVGMAVLGGIAGALIARHGVNTLLNLR
jgi:VanZ family protein